MIVGVHQHRLELLEYFVLGAILFNDPRLGLLTVLLDVVFELACNLNLLLLLDEEALLT